MVAFHDGHEHGDGEVCPGCRFREALARFFDESMIEGQEEWHWATGELRQLMHAALLAFDRIEAAAFDSNATAPGDDPSHDAAAAVVMLASSIDRLWHTLTDDDDDTGDDGE